MTLSYNPPSPSSSDLHSLWRSQSPISLSDQCVVKPSVRLGQYTSFRVGGPAQWYVAPRSVEDLQRSFEWAAAENLAITRLGAGSNLLVSDRGIPGLVICTRHLRHSHFDPATATITAAAGEPIAQLAWQAAKRGWQGLEWAVGIPGNVGGSVTMNAGAHDGCVADVLAEVQVISPHGHQETLKAQQLNFSYRTSALQGSDRLVTQAVFQLQPGADPQHVHATTHRYFEQRRNSQPYHLPSCGSVFRNPNPYKAGWLIEQTGLKGYQIGGAQVAQRHANFILNCGNATASDIFRLIRHVQQQVEQQWSLLLEPEVRMIGEFS